MEYIRIENNVIVELVSSSECPGKEWQQVKLNGGVYVGADTRMFDETWNILPIKNLIDSGFIKLRVSTKDDGYPAGTMLEKVQAGVVVPKSNYDLAVEGAVEVALPDYLDHVGKVIKTAESAEELRDLDVVSAHELDAYKALLIRQERSRHLIEVDRIAGNALRWAELTPDAQARIAQYRRDLLDVPQQAGFPWSVEWPIKSE